MRYTVHRYPEKARNNSIRAVVLDEKLGQRVVFRTWETKRWFDVQTMEYLGDSLKTALVAWRLKQ